MMAWLFSLVEKTKTFSSPETQVKQQTMLHLADKPAAEGLGMLKGRMTYANKKHGN